MTTVVPARAGTGHNGSVPVKKEATPQVMASRRRAAQHARLHMDEDTLDELLVMLLDDADAAKRRLLGFIGFNDPHWILEKDRGVGEGGQPFVKRLRVELGIAQGTVIKALYEERARRRKTNGAGVTTGGAKESTSDE